MSSSTECQMQHWVPVHKLECHGPQTGSPGSRDTDSGTYSEVHSPGISRSENHKVFGDFTDTSNVNEVGPPAQVLLNPAATRMQQKLPSWTVTSNGQQRAKAKKVKCIQCLHESNRYEPMMDLLVGIQGDVKSLEDALAEFTDTELLDGANKYKCDQEVHLDPGLYKVGKGGLQMAHPDGVTFRTL
ncbi:unnamed protein product [Sphagnum jensenii]|uniref:Uncharacterized protein n=1 Tax=Sphagnum jensenii TaxID=128206 RepID=A0ABP1BI86_9BRYO